MRTGTVKGSLQLFGIIAVGTALFGLWQGYGIGETLIAAVILGAWHRPGWYAGGSPIQSQVIPEMVKAARHLNAEADDARHIHEPSHTSIANAKCNHAHPDEHP